MDLEEVRAALQEMADAGRSAAHANAELHAVVEQLSDHFNEGDEQ